MNKENIFIICILCGNAYRDNSKERIVPGSCSITWPPNMDNHF